jgi:hypothetical protein
VTGAILDTLERISSAPEDRLVEAYDEGRLVGPIFGMSGLLISDELLDRAEPLKASAVTVPVLAVLTYTNCPAAHP